MSHQTCSAIVLIFSASSILFGCGGAGAASTGAASPAASEEARPISNIVRPRAAYELRCSASRVEIAEIGDKTYAARGCGSETVYTCVGSMGQYACSRDGEITGAPAERPVPQGVGTAVSKEGAPVGTLVVPRAAHDLSCNASAIEVREVADKTYAVAGCSDQALYVCVGAMGHYQCQRE